MVQYLSPVPGAPALDRRGSGGTGVSPAAAVSDPPDRRYTMDMYAALAEAVEATVYYMSHHGLGGAASLGTSSPGGPSRPPVFEVGGCLVSTLESYTRCIHPLPQPCGCLGCSCSTALCRRCGCACATCACALHDCIDRCCMCAVQVAMIRVRGTPHSDPVDVGVGPDQSKLAWYASSQGRFMCVGDVNRDSVDADRCDTMGITRECLCLGWWWTGRLHESASCMSADDEP